MGLPSVFLGPLGGFLYLFVSLIGIRVLGTVLALLIGRLFEGGGGMAELVSVLLVHEVGIAACVDHEIHILLLGIPRPVAGLHKVREIIIKPGIVSVFIRPK